MNQEIHEQPEALARLIDTESARVWEAASRWHATPPRFIFIAARGTSDHAALYGKYLLETISGIPVGLAAPSVASVYHAPLRLQDGLVIGISQSGAAEDVAAVLEQAHAAGADTLAITNVADSLLARTAQTVIPLHAGPERAVAATKTFTATMAALLLLAAGITRQDALRSHLLQLPALVQQVFDGEEAIRAGVVRFRYLEECVVLGRGYNLATAYELALKLRETSYIRAQPFASPDFVHGPIAIIDEGYPVLAFANSGPAIPSILQVIAQTRARGAEAVVIGNAPEALAVADVRIPVSSPETPELLSPFPSIVAGQLFVHALALLRGHNPDAPRGLNKVTVTR